MKVIFLDIDGVLNTARTFRRQHKIWKETGERGLEIDEFRVFYLQKIVEQTGAIIVLSSSWRNFLLKKMVNLFLNI